MFHLMIILVVPQPLSFVEQLLTDKVVSLIVQIFGNMTELPELLGWGDPDLFCSLVKDHCTYSLN